MKVKINDKLTGRIPATQLKIGQAGILRYPGKCDGHVLLRTYSGLVSLNRPSSTWDGYGTTDAFVVELLPAGTEITLTVED